MAVRVLSVVGARPQFIKAAPVSRALKASGAIEEILVHTGQHFDDNMSDVFFRELSIPKPQHSLGIHGGNHGEMTGRMLVALENLFVEQRPDWVMVYGDTNSTLAGALAAAKLCIRVAHVEAGLRSFNDRMPEEINRVVADRVSSLLLCPTSAAVNNLRNEGISRGVHHVGDVMYDATLAASEASSSSKILETLRLQPEQYSVATVHRAENTDDPAKLAEIFDFLREQAQEYPIVLPLHPRTQLALKRNGISRSGILTCDPLGYLDLARLIADSRSVLTDSGGLQKEAYFYRKPCVTLRDETEWVETVTHGWNRLWRTPEYQARREITEYGSGSASEEIARQLLSAA
jgi:UDP-GlcNAc3NAcA epimerase